MTAKDWHYCCSKNKHGFARFPRPRHRLRANLAHSPLDRGHQYQCWLGLRSISPFWSPILSPQLSRGSAQFVSFPSGNSLVRFWFRYFTTANDFTHAQDSSDGDIAAVIKANSRVRDGKNGHFEKGRRN